MAYLKISQSERWCQPLISPFNNLLFAFSPMDILETNCSMTWKTFHSVRDSAVGISPPSVLTRRNRSSSLCVYRVYISISRWIFPYEPTNHTYSEAGRRTEFQQPLRVVLGNSTSIRVVHVVWMSIKVSLTYNKVNSIRVRFKASSNELYNAAYQWLFSSACKGHYNRRLAHQSMSRDIDWQQPVIHRVPDGQRTWRLSVKGKKPG